MEVGSNQDMTNKARPDEQTGLGKQLHTLIERYVSSVEQLEILHLLMQQPLAARTIEDIFHVVQSSRGSVANSLNQLAGHGFVQLTPEGKYGYAPRTAELAGIASDLCSAYKHRRVTMIETIYSRGREAQQGDKPGV